MKVGIEIVTDRRVALKFDTFPVQAHDALLDVITSSTERLRALVEGAAPKRTGKLEAEITSRVIDATNHITGSVGFPAGLTPTEYGKAAALEYGAHGTAHLRAHSAKLGHLWGKLIAPIQVLVAAHDRRLNIAKRDFLRGPLHAIEDGVLADMKGALDQAVAE
jgi:hypothetical protein